MKAKLLGRIHDYRYHSVMLLSEFDKTKNQFQFIRNKYFTKESIDPRTKSKVTALTNSVIRLRGRLDFIICSNAKINFKKTNVLIINILRISTFGILFNPDLPVYAIVDSAAGLAKTLTNNKGAGFVNAILRKIDKEFSSLSDWESKYEKEIEWYSIPTWLYKKWERNYKKTELKKLLNKINNNPPFNIRFSPSKISSKNLINELNKDSIKVEENKNHNKFLKIKNGLSRLLSSNLFQKGEISLQDPAAGTVIDLLELKDDDIVIDACAAPGTKTLQIAQKLSKAGMVLASDISPKRVKMGVADIKRHNLKNIQWSVKDAATDSFESVAKILIDVPCSGTGVLARKPDIRWRRKKSDILRFSELQFSILKNMSKYLLRGGEIIYSTCSLEKEENWSVVERFLNLNSDFIIIPAKLDFPKGWINDEGCLETLPHIHGVDGMFAAKLKRKK